MVERMRATIPGVAVRTSFIVGFPGETDADFEQLCNFVRTAEFDRVGVFRYSDDETQASYALDQKVDAKTSYNRQRKLMAIQRKISRRSNQALVGREFPILIGGPSAETELLWEARMQSQAEEIDGKTFLTDFGEFAPKPGDTGRVRIERATDYDVFGSLVGLDERSSASKSKPEFAALPVLQ